MADNNLGILERFLNYNRHYVRTIRHSRRTRWIFSLSPKMRQLYALSQKKASPQEENIALALLLNAYEETFFWKTRQWVRCAVEDISLFLRQWGKRKTIDHSDKRKKDYYSVAVIVKNEARYLKEWILFYQVTGADRIYLYDNDSTDDLMQVIRPFIESGFLIYRQWSGHTVQTGAYRDAVRRAKERTKWLALIDADEFLFSPKGPMPQQLKPYESYPGVGVNWVMFGPGGHDRRPKGLVMDAYTSAHQDPNVGPNCHIKSVVQPEKVLCVNHVHHVLYKKGYAVGEDGAWLDNRTTRSFSLENHREIFRINHYCTKSLEDLEEKRRKGRADGSPDVDPDNLLRQFDLPMTEDLVIRPYADRVRAIYEE